MKKFNRRISEIKSQNNIRNSENTYLNSQNSKGDNNSQNNKRKNGNT